MSTPEQRAASKPPKPTTTRAVLVSEGFPNKPTWTVHHYVATELEDLGGSFGEVWCMIYECFSTGARRRWGIETTAWDIDGVN